MWLHQYMFVVRWFIWLMTGTSVKVLRLSSMELITITVIVITVVSVVIVEVRLFPLHLLDRRNKRSWCKLLITENTELKVELFTLPWTHLPTFIFLSSLLNIYTASLSLPKVILHFTPPSLNSHFLSFSPWWLLFWTQPPSSCPLTTRPF